MITETSADDLLGGTTSANNTPVIDVRNLTRKFGKTDAVHELSFSVRAGTVYGLFGRNGAGKTTFIKCLLNLLRPTSGSVRLFGLDPARNEVTVKRRLAYVSDSAAFYPWMTVRATLDYFASFRERWDSAVEGELLDRFRLDPTQRATALSKGQAMQLALVIAICPGPDLLILDEPTTGLDPMIRREFLEAVIGAYQDADPERRTIFVSTHMISEFEGLVDDFTILECGRSLVTSGADDARARYRRIRARFPGPAPVVDLPELVSCRRSGRELDLIISGTEEPAVQKMRDCAAESVTVEGLDLESIFIAAVNRQERPS